MKKIIVSKFKNYESTSPIDIDLFEWLNDTTHKETVLKIRNLTDKTEIKKLKSKLPCITPSGTFIIRNDNGLIQHSGFICIDIDGADNIELGDFSNVRDELTKIKNIFYTGLSVSGNGVFCLIPIKYPEKHKEHFEALKMQFKRIGIVIDKACRNVSRLRGYSYDPEAYLNKEATTFNQTIEFKKSEPYTNKKEIIYDNSNSESNTFQKVMRIVNDINESGIDITEKYEQWFQIACALANEFGEEGRDFFHLVSQHHPKYHSDTVDLKFSECLKNPYSYNIGTFFYWAEEYGFK